ncbi:sensor domain-containing diguanylate cyclase [Rhodoferax sp. BLA1]|uniref:sensor domain-containing diguanylate cyclase n=1 Tax=Rhodoferax sp. BLA1 TaxID=2576062 RepID=UPI0015D15FA8|nr:sensor domain-containing diguanylate cyclase [Rhodoferax sp. BLA1]
MSLQASEPLGRESTWALLAYGLAALVALSGLVLLLLQVQSTSPRLDFLGPLSMLLLGLAGLLTTVLTRANRRQISQLNALGEELADYAALLEQNTDLLERAQNVANMGSWVSDIPADDITPSPQGCKILGLPAGAHIRFEDYLGLVHEEDRASVKDAWKDALKQGAFDGEHRILVNGRQHWVRHKGELEYEPGGQAVSALGIVQDITEQKCMRIALKNSEARYRTLIEWTPDAVLVHRHTQIMYANPAALKLFGAPDLHSLLSKHTTDLVHPVDLDSQRTRMLRMGTDEPPSTPAEARCIKLDGSPIDVEVQGTAIEFDGEPAVHVSIRDITQRKFLEHEIRLLAFYDTLTQLPNRRLLDDRLSQAINANRRSGGFGALMFLDLDNFKPLNDTYGHGVGDLLLKEAAQRLKACVREMDTVARFGGDEFVVLLTELDTDWQKSRQFAENVALKIKTAMAKPYSLPLQDPSNPALRVEHRCTASIGVVVFASASNRASAQDLTKWADAAMYQAKNEGRNRICFSEHSAAEAVDHYFFNSYKSSTEKG